MNAGRAMFPPEQVARKPTNCANIFEGGNVFSLHLVRADAKAPNAHAARLVSQAEQSFTHSRPVARKASAQRLHQGINRGNLVVRICAGAQPWRLPFHGVFDTGQEHGCFTSFRSISVPICTFNIVSWRRDHRPRPNRACGSGRKSGTSCHAHEFLGTSDGNPECRARACPTGKQARPCAPCALIQAFDPPR